MTAQFGTGTRFYPSKQITEAPQSIQYDLAVIGCLSTAFNQQSWSTSKHEFWPYSLGLEVSPGCRAIYFQKPMEHAETPWSAIDRLGGMFAEVLEKFRTKPGTPIVFICHGLGGFVLLRALEMITTHPSSAKLTDETTCVVFLGSPINRAKDDFYELLRRCATAELAVSMAGKKVDKLNDEEISGILRTLEAVRKDTFPIASIFESKSSMSNDGPKGRLWGRFKIDKVAASAPSCKLIETNLDHLGISSIDERTYGEIFDFVSTNIQVMASKALRYPPTDVSASTRMTIAMRGNSRKSNLPLVSSPGQKHHQIQYPPNPLFMGRSDILTELQTRLVDRKSSSGERTRCPSFALWGAPGMGKTQVARRFVSVNDRHFDYILWAVADREEKIKQRFSDFAVELSLKDKGTDITVGANALVDHLRRTDNRWLLVFDDAKDGPTIKQWWPDGDHGSILITTNNRIFATSSYAGHGQEISRFDEGTAVDFVVQEIPPHAGVGAFDAKKEALDLAKRLSFMPLAISTAVGQINKLDCTLFQYNRSYSNHQTFWDDASQDVADRLSAPYSRGLKDVLNTALTYEGDAKILSEVFSLLESDNIQEELLDRAADSEGFKDVGFVKNRINCIQVLCATPGLIARNSLDPDRYPGFHIHGLFRDYIRENMTDASKKNAFDMAVRILCLVLGDKGTDYPKLFKEFFYHVQSLIGYRKSAKSVFAISDRFIELLSSSSWLCYRRGLFTQGLSILDMADEILRSPEENLLEGDPETLLTVEMGINYTHASIATEMGDFNLSLQLFNKAKLLLETGQERNPSFGPGLLTFYLGGIANSLQGLGRDEEAEVFYSRCLSSSTAQEYNYAYHVNICRSYIAMGLLEKASARLCELIKLRNAAHGENDQYNYISGHMRYVLGNARIAQSRSETDQTLSSELLEEGFLLHKNTLTIWLGTYGKEHHKTGDAHHKLGWHLHKKGQLDQAKKKFEDALETYNSCDVGYRDAEIARTSYHIGLVLKDMGEEKEMQKFFDESERLRKSIQGADYSPIADEEVYERLVSPWSR